MLTKREELKIGAVKAFYSCNRNIRRAVACFSAEHPDHGYTRPDRFIMKWVERFEETGSLDDKPHEWQHQLPDEVAMDCANELVKHAYHTIEDACEHNAFIKAVMEEYDITWQHLLRRMHQVDPELDKCVTFEVKMALRPEIKLERKTTAQQLLAWYRLEGPAFLLRGCFVDSKVFVTTPVNFKGWGRKHQRPSAAHIVIEDAKMDKNTVVKVNIYACVSPLLGLVHAKVCSGTTGFQSPYQVRAAAH